jgi:ribosomal protein S27AE
MFEVPKTKKWGKIYKEAGDSELAKKRKTCENCHTEVVPMKGEFVWGGFLVLFFLLSPLGGVAYAVYHHTLKPRNKCPACGKKIKLERAQYQPAS